jgi:hypothetical protein
MSNEQKTRTLIEDLPTGEQELTAEEMANVQGGVEVRGWDVNAKPSIASAVAPPPPPPGPLNKAADPNKNKDKLE